MTNSSFLQDVTSTHIEDDWTVVKSLEPVYDKQRETEGGEGAMLVVRDIGHLKQQTGTLKQYMHHALTSHFLSSPTGRVQKVYH